MIIPYLREDLEIFRGNSREDGSPAWLLYDALRNKYFTLGLAAFRLIKNWRAGEDIKSFEKKINQERIETNSEEIKSFVNFLQQNNLKYLLNLKMLHFYLYTNLQLGEIDSDF